jgi:hypothetical protein
MYPRLLQWLLLGAKEDSVKLKRHPVDLPSIFSFFVWFFPPLFSFVFISLKICFPSPKPEILDQCTEIAAISSSILFVITFHSVTPTNVHQAGNCTLDTTKKLRFDCSHRGMRHCTMKVIFLPCLSRGLTGAVMHKVC